MAQFGTIEETAQAAGHHRWVELRLFELMGGWVPEVPELDVKTCLGAHSHHHAWHAELWERRLPAAGGLSAEQVTLPSGDGLEAFFGALAEAEGAERTIEKLTGVYRVLLPRKIAVYTRALASASPVADAPTIRTLRLAITDELEGWREGEALLQTLLTSRDAVDRAASWQARIEGLLVDSGGLARA